MAKSKKSAASKETPLLSFGIGQSKLLELLARAAFAADRADKGKQRILVTLTGDGSYTKDEIVITAAGHPVSVVARATTQTGEGLSVHHAGACIVDLNDLRAITSAMPMDILDILVTPKGRLTMEAAGHGNKAHSRSFSMQIQEAADYPPVPEIPSAVTTWHFTAQLLDKTVNRVLQLALQDWTKPEYKGAMVHVREGTVNAIGTNGRSAFAVATVPPSPKASNDQPPLGDGEFFLSEQLLGAINSLTDKAGAATFARDEARVYARIGETSITCLLPNLPYPPWQQLLAASRYPQVCTFDATQLHESCKAMQTVFRLSYIKGDVRERTGVPLSLELEGAELSIAAGVKVQTETDDYDADGMESLAVQNPDNAKARFVMEQVILSEAARAAVGITTMSLDSTDPLSPVVLKTEGFIAILMPRAA